MQDFVKQAKNDTKTKFADNILESPWLFQKLSFMNKS